MRKSKDADQVNMKVKVLKAKCSVDQGKAPFNVSIPLLFSCKKIDADTELVQAA